MAQFIGPQTGTFRQQDYSSQFRNAQNQLVTKGLFEDQIASGNYSRALYTLKTYDYKSYPSLYRLYMEMEDLTEYDFAQTYFESWDHWKLLCLSNFFKPHISKWRKELDLKIRAKALKAIRAEAEDPKSKNSFQANKILIDRSWESKLPDPLTGKVSKRGRPSDQEVTNELKDIAKEAAQLEEDYKRITDGGDSE